MQRRYYFEKMRVWQNARSLTNDIYKITRNFPKEENYHLTSQMIRSASSVKSNIAEGQGRKSRKDQAHFTSIAYSSLIELLNHLITSLDQGFINENEYLELRKRIELISNQLTRLKKEAGRRVNNQISESPNNLPNRRIVKNP